MVFFALMVKDNALRSGTRRGSPSLLLPLNIVLIILAKGIKQEKEIKVIQIGKEEIKPSFS
jgi:hypothetical protein